MKTKSKVEDGTSQFQRWYKEKGEKLNKDRKSKYHSDPEYRQSVLDRQARYRQNNPPASRARQKITRIVEGAEVEVVRMGDLVKMIGRSENIIRNWEKRGIIPKPSIESKHRYYTLRQVALLKELADIIDVCQVEGREVLQTAIETKSSHIHKHWK